MVDSTKCTDWIEKASKDIKAAQILKENDCGNDLVAFHCQQAVEKLLKAYIIANTGIIINSHSLIYLCKEAENIIQNLKIYKRLCFCQSIYIETRYPWMSLNCNR